MKIPFITQVCVAAAASLGLATVFTLRQASRLATAEQELSIARLERARSLLVPAPTVTASTIDAPSDAGQMSGVSPSFAARLEELKKRAIGRAPGGVPLINPEDLFDYHAPLRNAYLDAQRGRQWVDYGPYFASAGLTGSEIEQFTLIGMERELAWLELRKRYPGPNKDNAGSEDPAAREMNDEANRAKQAKLAVLLGEDRFQQLIQYQEELLARTRLLGLRNLVATTFYTDEPVTAAQMNQLAALATEYGMFSPAKAIGIPDAFDQLTVKSARILSPRQLQIFDMMLDHEQYALGMWQLRSQDPSK